MHDLHGSHGPRFGAFSWNCCLLETPTNARLGFSGTILCEPHLNPPTPPTCGTGRGWRMGRGQTIDLSSSKLCLGLCKIFARRFLVWVVDGVERAWMYEGFGICKMCRVGVLCFLGVL